MLDKEILNQLKGIFANLESDISFRLAVKDDSSLAEEMKSFLEDLASTSTKLSVEAVVADVKVPMFEIFKMGFQQVSASAAFQTAMNSQPFCWPY